jgi:hypothetical protein
MGKMRSTYITCQKKEREGIHLKKMGVRVWARLNWFRIESNGRLWFTAYFPYKVWNFFMSYMTISFKIAVLQ